MRLVHICDGCGVRAVLTPDEAFDLGWDHPPRVGAFGPLTPRLCPNCDITKSVWWALMMLADGIGPMLTAQQIATIDRVAGEPETILVRDDEGGCDDE